MLLALLFLAGGGVACTIFLSAVLYALAWMPWPAAVAALRIGWLGWLGMGAVGLIAIVLTGFSFVLGRRAWKAKGPGGLEFGAEGGGEDSAIPPTAPPPTTVTTGGPAAAQP